LESKDTAKKVGEDKVVEEKAKKIGDTQDLDEMFAEPEIVTVGKKKIKVRPAPLGELNRVTKMLTKIDKIGFVNPDGEMPKETATAMAEFIHDAIKDYHPNYTVEFIESHFPLSAFPDFSEARIQSNRFFRKMGRVQGRIPQAT